MTGMSGTGKSSALEELRRRRFYDRFDAVVLLSAPADVLVSRIESRTTNPYGKAVEQRETGQGPSA